MPMYTWTDAAPSGSGPHPSQQVRNLLSDAWGEDPANYDLDELTTIYIDEINSCLPDRIDVTPFGDIHIDGELAEGDHETLQEAFTEAESNFGRSLSLVA